MTKVFTCFVQIRGPKNGDQGVTAEGAFTVEDGVLTLTDREGVPATDERGKRYTHKLCEGENPKVIAGRLTGELRTALRGIGPTQGFAGPIQYRDLKRV
jgi:hypothetical protein